MRVILLQDVLNVGKKNEIKEVADGFARNYLLAKKLAKPATQKAMEQISAEEKKREEEAEKELLKIQETAAKLDGFELEITVKAGEKNQLFSSVNSQIIAKELKKHGFDIAKNQVELKEQIKELGESPVNIALGHGLEAEITVIVIAEEKNEEDIE